MKSGPNLDIRDDVQGMACVELRGMRNQRITENPK